MRIAYTLGADAIFALHVFVVAFVLVGWLFSATWLVYTYLALLVATLVLDTIFGYCILSKWEFQLRKKVHPRLTYDFAWATFYTYKITNHRISDRFYKRAALIALALVIATDSYFKFFF